MDFWVFCSAFLVDYNCHIQVIFKKHEEYKPLFAAYERAYPALKSIAG